MLLLFSLLPPGTGSDDIGMILLAIDCVIVTNKRINRGENPPVNLHKALKILEFLLKEGVGASWYDTDPNFWKRYGEMFHKLQEILKENHVELIQEFLDEIFERFE